MNLQGAHLIEELKEKSGLDHDFFDIQMNQILSTYSLTADTLDLEQLRGMLADYLQNLILEEEQAKSHY